MSSINHDVTTPAPPQLHEVDVGVFAYIQPDGTWWINNYNGGRPLSCLA